MPSGSARTSAHPVFGTSSSQSTRLCVHTPMLWPSRPAWALRTGREALSSGQGAADRQFAPAGAFTGSGCGCARTHGRGYCSANHLPHCRMVFARCPHFRDPSRFSGPHTVSVPSPLPDPTFLPLWRTAGDQTERFEVIRRVGSGSFGEIYEGRDLSTGEQVRARDALHGAFGTHVSKQSESLTRQCIGRARAAGVSGPRTRPVGCSAGQ
jgi:hypothetical protein